jgi:hypothetical protein
MYDIFFIRTYFIRVWSAICILFAFLYLESCQTEETKADKLKRKSSESQNMNTNDIQELVQSVLNKDPSSVLIARKVGQAGNTELRKLTKSDDAKVRRIALYCLDETGGSDAVGAFIDALMDKDPQVRGASLKGLNHHLPDTTYYNALLRAYDENPDPYVRQQVILIIGRLNLTNIIQDIKKRYERERDPDAQEGCIVVLAKLNDTDAQTEFVKRLKASSNRIRLRYLEEYCPYINAQWLLKPLLPILDDKLPLLYIGVDVPDMVQDLRACDLAINLISSISKHKFSFEINRATNYDDKQIIEVREYVQNL